VRRRRAWIWATAGATLWFPAATALPQVGIGLALTSAGAPLGIAAAPRPNLALGARGPAVVALQERLRDRSGPVAVDGQFGPATRRAVQALQKAKGLEADGVVGPATWRVLDAGSPVVVPATPVGAPGTRPVVRLGTVGPPVSELQRLLASTGRRITVDGRFGPDTHGAVLAFQRSRGLPVDGVVGPASWAALTSTSAVPVALIASTTRPPSRTIGATSYVVRAGDTMDTVAATTGSTPSALAAANRLAPGRTPTTGGTLFVPGAWRCPVPEGGFIDDYGFVRSDGRTHQGNDMFAVRGTPVVAPVEGRVEQRTGGLGGNAVHLYGADGHRYYFSHLGRYAAKGRVGAGAVIGYVGNTGNAVTTIPHLHFEIHPGGGASVNPFPTITLACKR